MIPRALYRLQLNRDFGFAAAAAVVPYLAALGISHCYVSPLLKARAGSRHGYDIVEHGALNPELGSRSEFDAFVATLHRHGMGLVIDIVPNHMAVGGDDNRWWLDVLEHGEASAFSGYFDIDWHPVNPALKNKVLLPFLGDHYGAVLEHGELQLALDSVEGTFAVRYYEHLFPIDPRTYPFVLGQALELAAATSSASGEALAGLMALVASCRALPRRTELSTPRRRGRQQGSAACKQQLADLCATRPETLDLITRAVARFNATDGIPPGPDLLHRLLEAQAYRLAYWQVAADDINYRRFFDINDLAGLRVEDPRVFEATHGLVRQLLTACQIDGLRVDHPDGLSDPYGYCCSLHDLATQAGADHPAGGHPYLVVEKILGSYEHLPAAWPVAGTTGYEVSHLLNGLLVDPRSARAFDRLYHRFTGSTTDFGDLLYECKKLVIYSSLESELTVLGNLASAIAEADRRTRDFTYHGLREAIAEIAACFPVYRTYIRWSHVGEDDQRYLQWAVAQAKKRRRGSDIKVFDFLLQVLALDGLAELGPSLQRKVMQFVLRFQQYTAPVMAKGMEDTAFYVYTRLVSLNDVGCDPRAFGVSPSAFHHAMSRRLSSTPRAMVTTSTHDSKRSEDVRARIDVLSEVPGQWRQHLARWRRLNRSKKRLVGGVPAPSGSDEYLLYQTLLGAWPTGPVDSTALAAFRERISAYMLKAARESKARTSWISPDEEYEAAIRHFVESLLDDPERNPFLADFLPFQRRLVGFGLLGSLSQTLLKLTVPGVPDIYQGNELWTFTLVDPDNRQPVDFEQRRTTLEMLEGATPQTLPNLLDPLEDGRAKLYVTWKALGLRRDKPDLFSNGDYVGLDSEGPLADHICAFARRLGDEAVLVVAARWFARLSADTADGSLLGRAWEGTRIRLPEAASTWRYRDVLCGRTVQALPHAQGYCLEAAALFEVLPVALLLVT